MKLIERLNDLVERSESYRQIMADGKVEDHEIEGQARVVEKLVERLEKQLSADDFDLVTELMAELSVFHAITNIK